MAKSFFYESLYSVYRDGKRNDPDYTVKKSPGFSDMQTEFLSDRSRILYSSAFRRLQQKAQVFSMETNSNVRSRLTHSLEVADLGRRLADQITYKMRSRTEKKEKISGFKPEEYALVPSIVENACLMHDIGNPPFGHFGESAIQDWATHKVLEALPEGMEYDDYLEGLMADFREFDGNPQGFRMVTRLLGEEGLCLTASTLLCALKYARTTGESRMRGDMEPGILKKAGWFQTEQDLVQRLADKLDRRTDARFPLTYIMEAADDISYCMSDIADGIEKRILTEKDFIRTFYQHWLDLNQEKIRGVEDGKENPEQMLKMPVEITAFFDGSNFTDKKMKGFNMDFAIPWARRATEAAVDNFAFHVGEIMAGTAEPLMSYDGEMVRVLEVIGKVCGELLYPSIEAESIELTGYAVISGIIENYTRLLKLSCEDFTKVVNGKRKKFPVETRLYNRFDADCANAYKCAVAALKNKLEKNESQDEAERLKQYARFEQEEWWLRVHLLMDHISSMTDAYALETYQMLEGIALMRT